VQGNSAGHDTNLRRLPLPWLIDTESVILGREFTCEAARGLPWLHCVLSGWTVHGCGLSDD
jgi:hypothetical protein